MERKEILEKLNEIFIDVFDDMDLKISENITNEDIEDWDSLMHISLIVSIEKSFNVKFSIEEVTNMKSIARIIDNLIERV